MRFKDSVTSVKRKLLNEDGATSVLVVFLVVVLSTLGAFAMLSANINVKSAEKVRQWNEGFYGLDTEAERVLSRIDGVFLYAGESSRAFFDDAVSPSPNGVSIENVSEEVLAAIALGCADAADKEAYMRNALQKLYSLAIINNLPSAIGDSTITAEANGDSIAIRANIKSGGDTASIALALDVPLGVFNITSANNSLTVEKKDGTNRFTITSWQQTPEPFTYTETIEYWDPSSLGGEIIR